MLKSLGAVTEEVGGADVTMTSVARLVIARWPVGEHDLIVNKVLVCHRRLF